MELLALGRGQAVAAQTFIERCLLDPFPDRVGRGLELARQLIDATPRARQLDDAAPVFGRIWWMCSWHGEPPLLFLPNTVHESGSTPMNRRHQGLDREALVDDAPGAQT